MGNSILDNFWVIVSAVLVFLMQPGFMCLESGLTRAKNSINVAIKNLADFVFSVMGFWIVGFGLMFGLSRGGLFGTPAGWLGKAGFIDFAGSTVVHSVGGWLALAVLIVNTLIAAAAGSAFSLFFGYFLYRVSKISFLINGSLGGLVAITACCH